MLSTHPIYGKIAMKGSDFMLDKKSKQVLKVLNKIKDEDGYIYSSNLLVPYLNKKYNVKIINSVLWNLSDLEYLTCRNIDGTVEAIYLTYKGKNYKELIWLNIKNFIFKSIFTPILVAILTTLVTLWIKSIM